MNETVRLLQTHRSSRSYKSDPIPAEILDAIIESAHRAPTSINSQQISLVVVRNAASRARIAEIAGGQPWIAQAPVFIAVVADLYKTGLGVEKAGAEQAIQHSLEAIISAVSDAGITMATLMTAARAFGLGIVPIGGIRRDPQAMIDLLELPRNTFPIGGVVLGYVSKEAPQKPRMPIGSFRHEEKYHPETLSPAIDAYDRTLQEYWQKIGRADGLAWSANMAEHYSTCSRHLKAIAEQQGFTIEV
ncbi:MAG: NADPH-dependent oxidoreductase [Terracidiphilus sp.]|nr:NADPH-dependent oxidoreductase [Terracidiphilus sp.]MDR3775744.1 NADPH-dependent oxidoreductase [Terracidiphilus sp.]